MIKKILIITILLIGWSQPIFSQQRGIITFSLKENQVIPVHYYKNATGEKSARATVMVLHGVNRNASDYLENWIPLADKYNFTILAPEFTVKLFSGSSNYQLGGLGSKRDCEYSTFQLLDPIFLHCRELLQLDSEKYCLFGHSAGAQLIQRSLIFVPNSAVQLAIIANAGWYTFPDFTKNWPYGLQDAGLSTSQLAGTFSQRVILLLGKEDNKTNDKYLRKTQKAMEQGEHRLARGQKFYESIQTFCAQAKVKNHWKILEVSGVSHSPQKMSNKAARLIDQFCKNVVKKKKTK